MTTGDRNRAIAYLMRNFGMLDGDVDEVLDLYFRQCSLLVTCRDLAVAAATLANGGINPVTGAARAARAQRRARAQRDADLRDVRLRRRWTYDVGLPAKSGVSGGVIAVLPGQLGIGVFSPPLDAAATACAASRCARGSRRTSRCTHTAPATQRRPPWCDAGTPGTGVRSTHRAFHRGVRRARGPRATSSSVYELQGNLYFADAEQLIRQVLEGLDDVVGTLVLDGRAPLAASTRPPSRSSRPRRPPSSRAVGSWRSPTSRRSTPKAASGFRRTPLRRRRRRARVVGGRRPRPGPATDATESLRSPIKSCCEASPASSSPRSSTSMTMHELEAGEYLVHEGDPSDCVYFLLDGSHQRAAPRLRARGDSPPRRVRAGCRGRRARAARRIAALSRPRGSTSRHACRRARRCATSTTSSVDLPGLKSTIYANLAHSLSERLRRANGRIRTLEQ